MCLDDAVSPSHPQMVLPPTVSLVPPGMHPRPTKHHREAQLQTLLKSLNHLPGHGGQNSDSRKIKPFLLYDTAKKNSKEAFYQLLLSLAQVCAVLVYHDHDHNHDRRVVVTTSHHACF